MLGCDNYQSYLPAWSEEQWWLWWSTSLTCSCPDTLLCGGGAPSKWNGKLSQLAPHLTVWRAIFKIVNIFINAEWAGCSSCIRQPYNVLPYNCIKKKSGVSKSPLDTTDKGQIILSFFQGQQFRTVLKKRAETHFLVDLENHLWWVEVQVKIIHQHMELPDFFRHAIRNLERSSECGF